MALFKEVIRKHSYSIISFAVTFVIGGLIFSLRDIFGDNNYMFMHSDMQNQMMPVLILFIRQLLEKHNIIYSFDVGLGSGTIPIFTNGSCFSLFNFVLLFPIDINIKAFLLVILKLSFSSFAFCELSNYILKKNSLLSVAMSMAYALGGFNMAYYYVIIWQDGMYMVPLIILGILVLCKHKRNPWLIFAYSYLFICNFYSGYVIGIYSFLIFLCVLVYKSNSINNSLKLFIKYLFYVFLSILMASFLLLPTAVFLLNNDVSEATSFSNISINVFDLLRQMYIGQYYFDEGAGKMPYVYCGVLSLIGVLLFYINKKINKKTKILFSVPIILLTICMLTKPGYMFMHAFNNPDNFGNRFAFLFSFTALIMFIYLIKNFECIEKKSVISICLIVLVYIVIYYLFLKNLSKLDIEMNVIIVIINAIFICSYMLLFVYKEKIQKHFNVIVAILIFIELVFNGIVYNNIVDRSVTECKEVFDENYNSEKSTIMSLEDNYTRIVMSDVITFNNSQLLGYRSITQFSSFTNTNLRRAMRHLGYAVGDLDIKSMGYTPASGMLLGIDYYIDKDMNIDRKESLPIAFMSDEDIIDLNLDNNPFENINKILSAITGEDIEYYYNTGSNISINCYNMLTGSDIYNGEEVMIYSLENQSVPEGYIEFVDDTSDTEYMYADMQDSYIYYDSPIITGNVENYRDTFDRSIISTPHIVKMTYGDESSSGYIILDEDTTTGYYISGLYFYGTYEENLKSFYEKASQNSMIVNKMKDGFVSGKVISHGDKDILFTSIPYDDNWNVYIDKEKVDSIAILDNAFLGVKVPQGEHYIEFKYKDRWFCYGIVLSALGFFVTFIIFHMDMKKPDLDKDEK